MEIITLLFGEGKDLNTLNMCARAVVVFALALILIRISGRRSFGVKTALDNIIVVLLGAVLSRTVTGASPFVPTVAASLALVLIHRVIGWGLVRSKAFSKFIEGEKIILYTAGQFIEENMEKGLVCKEDIMQGLRKTMHTEDLTRIETVYIERNGEISAVEKKQQQAPAPQHR